MMGFALLASGSKGNCFILQDEHLSLAVDCGSTRRWLSQCFAALHLRPEELDGLLITHSHSDHISQLKLFAGRNIYSPVPLPGWKCVHVEAGVPFLLQHMTITPLALSHDAPETVGYVFENWQEKLVYITDTGYLKQEYLPLLKGADYIILESNHDSEMLMETSRPQMLKMRIAGDSGHLSNPACAQILTQIVTPKTRSIFLAHISQEANTRELALQTTVAALQEHPGQLNPHLWVAAAGQYEILKGGAWHEEGSYGTCGWTDHLEHHSLGAAEQPAQCRTER